MSRIPTSLRSALYAEKPEPRCAYCQSPERLLGIPLEADHIILRFARSGAAKPHWKTYACVVVPAMVTKERRPMRLTRKRGGVSAYFTRSGKTGQSTLLGVKREAESLDSHRQGEQR